MEKIMTLQSATRLAIAAALGLGIGFDVDRTLSNGPSGRLQPSAAISQVTSAGAGSQAVSDGPGYLPSQLINQAKEIEPLPPTF
jgi:hypothetical protein